ncbi:MAG: formylglycine-generating enzyme family protein, partial [Saprospiraceae bacterium]
MITETLLATAPTPILLAIGGHTFLMVPVRGGIFDMGDEDLWEACRPVHPVQLDNFWIGQFPVTQALWRAVSLTPALSRGEGVGLDPDPSFFKGDQRPVDRVSWKDTEVFLEKLNELQPGWNFRLPTEAEWEYAARGGNSAYSDRVTGSHPVP